MALFVGGTAIDDDQLDPARHTCLNLASIRRDRSPWLMWQVIGSPAAQLETVDTDDIGQSVQRVLNAMFFRDGLGRHHAVQSPEVVLVSRWCTDPFALGSYAAASTEVSNEDYDAMAAAEGRVQFCGEHTSAEFPGTMHGAYLSGVAAGRRAFEALSGL